MNILKLLKKRNKMKPRKNVDFYQESVERAGRDEILKLVEKGLSFRVTLL